METVQCDYCGSSNYQTITQQTDRLHRTTDEQFTLVQCIECGLHYLNPRPDSAEIGRYYAQEYAFHLPDTKIKFILLKFAEWMANGFLRYFFCIIPYLQRRLAVYVHPSIKDPVRNYYQSGQAGAMLDIGCGAGQSAHFWGEQGSLKNYQKLTDVYGVEVAAAAREVLATHGITAYASLKEVPSTKKFSVIRMNWSLEHVHAPSKYFQFIANHLSDQGSAVIAVPNYDGIIYRMAPDCLELPIHLYHFRPEDIRRYAAKYGLEIQYLQTFSYPQMFVAAAQNQLFPATFAQPFSLYEALIFQKILNRFDIAGLGNDMIVILAKKNEF